MKIKFFRWYGGKIRLVETLKLLIPEHVEYVEPFAGSAAPAPESLEEQGGSHK